MPFESILSMKRAPGAIRPEDDCLGLPMQCCHVLSRIRQGLNSAVLTSRKEADDECVLTFVMNAADKS